MTPDEATLAADQPLPAPPPRTVPFGLHCHLLANLGTFFGSFFFGVGSVFALTVGLSCDVFGALRLAMNR